MNLNVLTLQNCATTGLNVWTDQTKDCSVQTMIVPHYQLNVPTPATTPQTGTGVGARLECTWMPRVSTVQSWSRAASGARAHSFVLRSRLHNINATVMKITFCCQTGARVEARI